MHRSLFPLIAGVGALVAGLVLFLAITQERRSANTQPAKITVLNPARPLPDFRLTDQAGRDVTVDRFKGRWSVLFFGFSHCPDICPTTLYDLARLGQMLSDLPAGQQPAVFFVSVDPERDTPEQLARYVRAFDGSFTGVTGDDAQIARLAGALGVAYGREPEDDGGYNVLHTAALFILNPDGNFVAVSSSPHVVADLARDYRALIERSGT